MRDRGLVVALFVSVALGVAVAVGQLEADAALAAAAAMFATVGERMLFPADGRVRRRLDQVTADERRAATVGDLLDRLTAQHEEIEALRAEVAALRIELAAYQRGHER